MSAGNITKYRVDPAKPHKTDWTEADELTDEEIHARALSDPDAQPLTPDELARAKLLVDVPLIRERFGLTQEEFARRFGLKVEIVRGWEDGSIVPDSVAVTLLRVIWAEPETVKRVVEGGE